MRGNSRSATTLVCRRSSPRSDGRTLWAARALGCDLAYLGTPIIASVESSASEEFKRAVVAAGIDDIEAVKMPTGLFANTIRGTSDGRGQAYAAGHTANAVTAIEPIADIVARYGREYRSLPEIAPVEPRTMRTTTA